MKLSYKRLGNILEDLLNNSANCYVSSAFLAKKYNVSARTIRSDIWELNKELDYYKVKIKNKRGSGFYLAYLDQNLRKQLIMKIVQSNLPASSSSERIIEIEQYLLVNNQIKLSELTDRFFISDNTFFTYLVTIKKDFNEVGLKIIKSKDYYYLKGTETVKRKFIITKLINKSSNAYIVGFTEQEKVIFANIRLDRLKQIVHSFLHQYNYSLSDINTKNIILHIALAISRVKLGYSLEKSHKLKIKGNVSAAISKLFINLEKEFCIKLNECERNDLIYHFAMNYPECVTDKIRAKTNKDINKAVRIF